MSEERLLKSIEATHELGNEIALWMQPGDFIALSGPLGTGKTVLAQAIIRAINPDIGEVTSPTFALMNFYPSSHIPIVHVDLYRLDTLSDLDELGIESALENNAALVEWADRMGESLPVDRLEILLDDHPDASRQVNITGFGSWEARLSRALDLHAFVAQSGWASASRSWLKGDASTRLYQRLEDVEQARKSILMNSPADAVRSHLHQGKTYSQTVHLAENVQAFVALNQHLLSLDLSAPRLLAMDMKSGFLILEDFGDGVYGNIVTRGEEIRVCYHAAIEALCTIQSSAPPDHINIAGGGNYVLNTYDIDALIAEVELVLDWAWPVWNKNLCPEDTRFEYLEIWRKQLNALPEPTVLVLRDFHSPNLMWLPERSGAARAGLLDFQDAVIGHPAYDLVSLAQDARIDLPADLEEWIIKTWLDLRPSHIGNITPAQMKHAYHLLGAQRAAKIIGIFCRLAIRDHKPEYLVHLPRVVGYLCKNLQNPHLQQIASWFTNNIPLQKNLPIIQSGMEDNR